MWKFGYLRARKRKLICPLCIGQRAELRRAHTNTPTQRCGRSKLLYKLQFCWSQLVTEMPTKWLQVWLQLFKTSRRQCLLRYDINGEVKAVAVLLMYTSWQWQLCFICPGDWLTGWSCKAGKLDFYSTFQQQGNSKCFTWNSKEQLKTVRMKIKQAKK